MNWLGLMWLQRLFGKVEDLAGLGWDWSRQDRAGGLVVVRYLARLSLRLAVLVGCIGHLVGLEFWLGSEFVWVGYSVGFYI